jgi:hypothetical protein
MPTQAEPCQDTALSPERRSTLAKLRGGDNDLHLREGSTGEIVSELELYNKWAEKRGLSIRAKIESRDGVLVAGEGTDQLIRAFQQERLTQNPGLAAQNFRVDGKAGFRTTREIDLEFRPCEALAENLFVRRVEALQQVAQRALFYPPKPALEPVSSETIEANLGYVEVESEAKGVNKALVRAILEVESAHRRNALSNKGAMGLMQLMPDTAAALNVKNPWDAKENIAGGVTLIRELQDHFKKNGHDFRNTEEELVIAAYNAGQPAVDRYNGIPPYQETRDYVDKVKARKQQIQLEELLAARKTE